MAVKGSAREKQKLNFLLVRAKKKIERVKETEKQRMRVRGKGQKRRNSNEIGFIHANRCY